MNLLVSSFLPFQINIWVTLITKHALPAFVFSGIPSIHFNA
ncbi:hypothetical protein M23134_02289 [Microscilla marina ATCC 23134]|uniref:Uncharacterized protein n=1 Tax=Microscilla marina ATCC 23134 TaxID=313606 RepID=A1ZK72_MICM2|nr:hypothetical protein M23134_02289 [Microscilla marina ATCC 23134]